MSRLKTIRELQNLTQEELSEKSGVSVRTIQRIESGTEPKGYTLRVLAETFGVSQQELVNNPAGSSDMQEAEVLSGPNIDSTKLKLINLSSLPFTIVPLCNILVPLILMFAFKAKSPIAKQIISLQIMWTILAPILFLLAAFLRMGNKFTLAVMIVLVLSNVFIVLRNAISIDKKKSLHYQLGFNMI